MKVLAAISFCDIYTDGNRIDPERFQGAHRCISDKHFAEFVSASGCPEFCYCTSNRKCNKVQPIADWY